MSTRSRFVPLMVASALLTAPASAALPQDAPRVPPTSEPVKVEPRWLDRLEEIDRALIDENIGFAPPPVTDDMKGDLEWRNGEAFEWSDLRGKVIVVQSWTTENSPGRLALVRLEKALGTVGSDDVVLVALHTPEGADAAGRFLDRGGFDMPIIIDSKGLLCDEFGFYKRPTNVIIDRNGAIRFAGLNHQGAVAAVKALLEEEVDENASPEPRPKPEASAAPEDVQFPTPTGQVRSARDLRGQRAPNMYVAQWLNGTPDARNKVVIVDFWATWCGPCVASIPHMNELANSFRNDVVVVGLSDEDANTVQNFVRQTRFDYAVAVDPSGQMKRAMGISGIPNIMVVSSDWIVRWQGHPSELNAQVLSEIVAANRKLIEAASGSQAHRYRWTGGAAGQ